MRSIRNSALLPLLLTCGLAASGATTAAGNASAGEEKAAVCSACHGAEGVSQIKTYPILAGQHVTYLVHALKAYRRGNDPEATGARRHPLMTAQAANLSDEDIDDLAAYYASLKALETAPRY